MKKRLYRSRTERVLGGVAGGLAAYLDIDVVLIRIIWVFLALSGGPGLLAYLICWLVIPEEPAAERLGGEGADQSEPATPGELTEGTGKASGGTAAQEGGRWVFGIFLVLLGTFFLLKRLGGALLTLLHRVFPGIYWHQVWELAHALFWPSLLVVVGLILIAGSWKGRRG